MNLADSKQLANSSLTEKLQNVADLIYSGQYEIAQEVLGDLWGGIGVRPKVDQYPSEIAAEILLQCGCLSRLLGSAQPIKDIQERAKDLLFEALESFNHKAIMQKLLKRNMS
jgi:hypothetical protein